MILIDTYAWIEYFKGTEKGKVVEKYLDEKEIFTPSIVLVELSCKAAKESWNFTEYLKFIKSKSIITGMNEEEIIKCGNIYLEQRRKKPKFGMVDAIIWAISLELKARILTGDEHFKDLNNGIMI